MTARMTCVACDGVGCHGGRDCPLRDYPRLWPYTVSAARLGGGDLGPVDSVIPLREAHQRALDMLREERSKRHKSGRWFLLAGLIAGALLGWAVRGYAAEYHLVAHGLSHHFAERNYYGEKWNGTNIGAGTRIQINPQWDVQAGVFRNSYFRRSVYLATDYAPIAWGGARFGAFLGTANKYPANHGRFIPAAGIFGRWTVQRASVTVRATPPVGNTTAGMVAVEFGARVWG